MVNSEKSSIFENKSVFITGHTGFKGSWLSLWLSSLGARVHGYALDPPTNPSLFDVANVTKILHSDTRENILNLTALKNSIEVAQPEIIFHLAAQPLVLESYVNPLETFSTNVMGTVNLLEIIRGLSCVKAVVIVTTDKVYDNKEWIYSYRENEPLGGYDPYSASKAATEIVVSSYRSSFFSSSRATTRVATARAGNVIGGGDWAKDRLIPDCLKAFEKNEAIFLRNPQSVRPWQHVLEPISGYLLLAKKLLHDEAHNYCSAWNFGPGEHGDANVGDVANIAARLWGHQARVQVDSVNEHPHEANLLRLDITRARQELGWIPRWPVEQALFATIEWHRAWLDKKDMYAYSLEQILEYQSV